MDIKTVTRIKKEFFNLNEGMLELQRAINSGDTAWIMRLVRRRYVNLQRIYQLCDEEKKKAPKPGAF